MKHENIATIFASSSAIIVPIEKVFLWWLFSSFKKGSLFGYISMCNRMVMRKAQEIITIWTKRVWNYSLISRVYHLITY